MSLKTARKFPKSFRVHKVDSPEIPKKRQYFFMFQHSQTCKMELLAKIAAISAEKFFLIYEVIKLGTITFQFLQPHKCSSISCNQDSL